MQRQSRLKYPKNPEYSQRHKKKKRVAKPFWVHVVLTWVLGKQSEIVFKFEKKEFATAWMQKEKDHWTGQMFLEDTTDGSLCQTS